MDVSAIQHRTFTIRQFMAAIAGVACLLGGVAWADRSGSLWWLIQSFDLGVYVYPSFALAAGGGLLVALIAVVCDRSVWRIRWLWFLLPAAMPIAILFFGSASGTMIAPPKPSSNNVGRSSSGSPGSIFRSG